MPDGLHPSAKGYVLIADALKSALTDAMAPVKTRAGASH
jgi:lysophospholipase L1-like esterase